MAHMYLLNKRLYKETKRIKLGELKKSDILDDLSNWFNSIFDVEIINFKYKRIKVGKRIKHRLTIVTDQKEDYLKMVPRLGERNHKNEQKIVKKFLELTRKYNFNIDPRVKNIFVVFSDFSKEANTETNRKAFDSFNKELKRNYPDHYILQPIFDAIIVFFHTDEQVRENSMNGVSEAISDLYFSTLRKYDVCGYISRDNLNITFDSKENLDQNYEGNMYYYLR